MKAVDIATLGELLIDFTPYGVSTSGMTLYERNPGGAPANVAVAAAKLGLKTAFIGKVGDDIHGRFLRSVLLNEGVSVQGLVLDKLSPTTLAFVELKENGDRDFAFIRKGCGDTRLTEEELDPELIHSAKILHVGTLSLTAEPARTATFKALEAAKAAGVTISCDVNWREPLWESREQFINQTEMLLPLVDLLKVSDNEAEILTGKKAYDEAAEQLKQKYNLKAVAVTLGAKGAYFLSDTESGFIPAYKVKAIDSTGAGDCFWAACLYKHLENCMLNKENVRFACAAASICVERRGAIPAMPSLDEVKKRL
jgi:fructokinase